MMPAFPPTARKLLRKPHLLVLALLAAYGCYSLVSGFLTEGPPDCGLQPVSAKGGVNENGTLSVKGRWLLNQHGEPVALRGMSSHGLHYYPQYTGRETMEDLAGRGANLFRTAMYADSRHGGYNQDAAARGRNTYFADVALQNALSADMYAILDWHILRDQNPLHQVESAELFFDRMSAKYAGNPGVLYEICNEPNGPTSWEEISEYAGRIIPVIRKNSPGAVIIVGTPNYSTRILEAFAAPLPYENIMYALHYYPQQGRDDTLALLGKLLEADFPIFVSEWGVEKKPDSDELEIERASNFLAFMHRHKVSWANWSLCNKDESYSAIRTDVEKLHGWEDDELTPAGRLVFDAFRWGEKDGTGSR